MEVEKLLISESKERDFDKECTWICKGLLVIMLLVHHLLFPGNAEKYAVNTIISDLEIVDNIALWCKLCVPGFTFLSAYGMTKAYMKCDMQRHLSVVKVMFIRLLNIEAAIIPIYILAVGYKRFIMHESIKTLYSAEGIELFYYMLIDGLGLARCFNLPTINVTWWYMSFAILLVVLMPIFFMAYEKFRYILIPISILAPIARGENVQFNFLMSSVILGIAFAYENGFVELKKVDKWVKAIFFSVSLVVSYQLVIVFGVKYSYVFAWMIPFATYEIFVKIPILNKCLLVLGRYATNIFLLHTFIYYYFYADFVYSFKHSFVITGVLLALSLVLSWILEMVKKCIGFDKFISMIRKKISSIE